MWALEGADSSSAVISEKFGAGGPTDADFLLFVGQDVSAGDLERIRAVAKKH